MDKLGQRLISDRDRVIDMRRRADALEREVSRLRNEANEIERLAELARVA
jgi:hypothetical protein